MPVEFTCDGCNRRLRAPDAKAGKRVTCPTCGKDLNAEPHEHPGEAIDGRWAALEVLRADMPPEG